MPPNIYALVVLTRVQERAGLQSRILFQQQDGRASERYWLQSTGRAARASSLTESSAVPFFFLGLFIGADCVLRVRLESDRLVQTYGAIMHGMLRS